MGKAFDTLGEIKRDQLKKPQGWHYLLTFLEDQRGRAKVDILGDTFTEFFLRKDAYRRDGEEINDYKNHFKTLMRRMEKALAETNSTAKMPVGPPLPYLQRPSLLGWRPSLLGWRPSLLGWRPSLLGWRPSLFGWEAIPMRLEAFAIRLGGHPYEVGGLPY